MKQISDETTRYQIRGMLVPINPATKQPVFLETNDEFILPIFTTRDKFKAAAKWGGFGFAQANIIVDPQSFQSCVLFFSKKFSFHVAIDPYLTEDGNTRFNLISLDKENEQES